MTVREDGFALVSVLSIVLILSLLAASLTLIARDQARSATQLERRVQAVEAADAAILRTMLGMADRRREIRAAHAAGSHTVENNGDIVTVTVSDELGYIDLNTAEEHLLRSLFEAAGVQPEAAAALVDRIRDWSDEDDLRRLNGAEAGDYRAGGMAHEPRNQPFASVNELLLVKEMDRELYNQVMPALTVFSGRRSVDPTQAAPAVRRLLKLEETGEGTALNLESLGGRAFRFEAAIDYAGGGRLVREATIRFTDDPKDPFWVHYWGGAASY